MSTELESAQDWEPLKLGELVQGKYRVGQRLGSGGMGIVYRAEHVTLRIPVAVKVMRSELSGAQRGMERMLQEARAAARLRSEHIVKVLDVGRLELGLPYIVMEFLEGCNLGEVLETSGPLPLEAALDFVAQACSGLSEAHAAGIVHRDLKPENLFLTRRADGSPLIKVFDFGISKEVGATAIRVTEAASTVGSPAYMSPEQIRAEDVDARSDIWALGIVLTELCTGVLPFDGASLVTLFEAVQRNAPRLPSALNPALPAALDAIVLRCLNLDPQARYTDAHQLACALRNLSGEKRASDTTGTRAWAATSDLPLARSHSALALSSTPAQPSSRRRIPETRAASSGNDTFAAQSKQPAPPGKQRAALLVVALGLGLLVAIRFSRVSSEGEPRSAIVNPSQFFAAHALHLHNSAARALPESASAPDAPIVLEEPAANANEHPPNERRATPVSLKQDTGELTTQASAALGNASPNPATGTDTQQRANLAAQNIRRRRAEVTAAQVPQTAGQRAQKPNARQVNAGMASPADVVDVSQVRRVETKTEDRLTSPIAPWDPDTFGGRR